MARCGLSRREGEMLHLIEFNEPAEEVLSEDLTVDLSQARVTLYVQVTLLVRGIIDHQDGTIQRERETEFRIHEPDG